MNALRASARPLLLLLLAACDPNGPGPEPANTCEPPARQSNVPGAAALTFDVGSRANDTFTPISSGDSVRTVFGAQGGLMLAYHVRLTGGGAKDGDCLQLQLANSVTPDPPMDLMTEDTVSYDVESIDGALMSGPVFHVIEFFGDPSKYSGKTLTTTIGARVGDIQGERTLTVTLLPPS